MTCEKCGSPCQGALCKGCDVILANEARYGTDSSPDDGGEWSVPQQGLDGDVDGQVDLEGDLVRRADQ